MVLTRTRRRTGEFFNELPHDVLWHLLSLQCERLIVPPVFNGQGTDKVSIHNGLVPMWYHLNTKDLSRMMGVCRLWRELAGRALKCQLDGLVAWGHDRPPPMNVTVPRPPPGEPLCMVFEVTMENGKHVSVTRPADKRASDIFEFDYSLSKMGLIQTWVIATHEAPLPRVTRGRPGNKKAQRLHEMQSEVLKKIEPLVSVARLRARLHKLEALEVKRLLLDHVRSCKARSCNTCRKLRERIRAQREAREAHALPA